MAVLGCSSPWKKRDKKSINTITTTQMSPSGGILGDCVLLLPAQPWLSCGWKAGPSWKQELLSSPFLVQQSPLVEAGSSLPGTIRLLQCAACPRGMQPALCHSVPCGPSLRGGGTDPKVPPPPLKCPSALCDCIPSCGDSQVFPRELLNLLSWLC